MFAQLAVSGYDRIWVSVKNPSRNSSEGIPSQIRFVILLIVSSENPISRQASLNWLRWVVVGSVVIRVVIVLWCFLNVETYFQSIFSGEDSLQ